MQGQVLASTGQQRFNSITKTIHFAHLVIILFIYGLTATKGLDWRIRRGWVAEITSYLFFKAFRVVEGGRQAGKRAVSRKPCLFSFIGESAWSMFEKLK